MAKWHFWRTSQKETEVKKYFLMSFLSVGLYENGWNQEGRKIGWEHSLWLNWTRARYKHNWHITQWTSTSIKTFHKQNTTTTTISDWIISPSTFLFLFACIVACVVYRTVPKLHLCCVCLWEWLNTIFLFNFSSLDIKKRLESPRPNYSFSSFFRPRCLLLQLLLLAHVTERISHSWVCVLMVSVEPKMKRRNFTLHTHPSLPQFRGKRFSTNFLRGTTDTNTLKANSAPRNRIIINRTNTFFTITNFIIHFFFY